MTNQPAEVFFAPLERHLGRLLSPFEEFVHRQTSSGLLLMASTILALVIANSALAPFYHHLLEVQIGIRAGDWGLQYSLEHWINDGLMTLFFFVVGLELKREMLVGELADLRKAALPVIAAAGGMLVPALIYCGFNPAGEAARGWGIAMATDIAFAVGILALLGSRVPKSLVTFLVALAIADDLGAVAVIALFYTASINLDALAMAAFVFFLLMALNVSGVRRITPYFLLALPLWYALLRSGVHPTLAGILGAFAIPAQPKYQPEYFSKQVKELIGRFDNSLQRNPDLNSNEELRTVVHDFELSTQKVMTPLQRLEHFWHLPVAFLVIPVFALANAGIPIDFSASMIDTFSHPVFLGVMFGLVAGKFAGILGFSWLAIKTGIARLPEGIRMSQIAGAAMLGGIGFTMSIFIAQLSFTDSPHMLLQAKFGILLASLIAGLAGFIWLSVTSRRES